MKAVLVLGALLLTIAGCATTDTATPSTTSTSSTPPPLPEPFTIPYPPGWSVAQIGTVRGATHPWIVAGFTTPAEAYIGIASPDRDNGTWTMAKLATGPTQIHDLYAAEKDGKVHAMLDIQQSPSGFGYAEWATFDGTRWTLLGPTQWPYKTAQAMAVAGDRLFAIASYGATELWSSPDGAAWTLEAPVPGMKFSAGLAGNRTHLMVCGLAANGDRVVMERALPGATYETKVLRTSYGGRIGIEGIVCEGVADQHGAPFFGFSALGTFVGADTDNNGYGAVRTADGWESTRLTPDGPYPLAVHASGGTFYEMAREGTGDLETILFRHDATGWQVCPGAPARNISNSPGFLDWQGRTWIAHLTWDPGYPLVLTPLPDKCAPL